MSQPADPSHAPQDDAATQDVGTARSADDVAHDGTPSPTPRPPGEPNADPSAAPSAEAAREGLGDRATGDIVIDAALQDLRDAPADDLDAQIEAGRRVHRTLQGRLSDLGGE